MSPKVLILLQFREQDTSICGKCYHRHGKIDSGTLNLKVEQDTQFVVFRLVIAFGKTNLCGLSDFIPKILVPGSIRRAGIDVLVE